MVTCKYLKDSVLTILSFILIVRVICIAIKYVYFKAVADPEGVQGVRLNPSLPPPFLNIQ